MTDSGADRCIYSAGGGSSTAAGWPGCNTESEQVSSCCGSQDVGMRHLISTPTTRCVRPSAHSSTSLWNATARARGSCPGDGCRAEML